MRQLILISTLIYSLSALINAQTLSEPMERAIDACINLSNAIGSSNTSQLRAANKALKAAEIVDFGDLWLVKGEDLCVDGHFIFDEEFIDSLIENREVIRFSSKYMLKRRGNPQNKTSNRIKMTTMALKARQNAVWKTINRRNAEYAIIAEPGGLFTMTIHDEKGKVLYAETVNNKKGEKVRKVKIQLPDKNTRIFIEIKNNSKVDASFALIGN